MAATLGGRYATSLIQYAQMLNYRWARNAVRDGSFVETMSYAVEHADYLLAGGRKQDNAYLRERFDGRFFRLHDSGDFFSEAYLEAWIRVAEAHPDVTFWAPTRIWATTWGVAAVNRLNVTPNLVIRPSAFEVNANPPADLGPGWSRGTYVLRPGPDVEDSFECGAYRAVDQAKSCRNAVGPDGKVGCRACWSRGDDLEITYRLH